MPFAEDLSAFFDLAGFAVSATLAGVAVRGIFDKAFALSEVGMSGMASTQPAFTLPASSVTGGVVGQSLVVNGVSYLVVAHEPDGTGVSRLLLEAA